MCMKMRCTYLVALLDIRIGVIIVHEIWLHLYREGEIRHVGGGSSFIPGALVIFRCHQRTGDCYNEMNGNN